MPRPRRSPKKKYDELDSEESEDEEDMEEEGDEEDDDSDFEDPDDIEVPGGGKNLQTLKKFKGGASPNKKAHGRRAGPASMTGRRPVAAAAAASAPVVVDLVDDDDVMALPTPSPAMPRPSTSSGAGLRPMSSAGSLLLGGKAAAAGGTGFRQMPAAATSRGGAAVGQSLLKPNLRPGGGGPGDSFGGLGGLGSAATALGAGFQAASQAYLASMMAAQDPTIYAQAGGADMFQKSLGQNGGDLSRYANIGVSNPFTDLAGGSTNPLFNMTSAAGGGLGDTLLRATASGLPGSAPLQAKQVSSLWMNNPYRVQPTRAEALEEEEVAAEDEDDMGVIETYSNYMPSKLKIGIAHPDPVVETASMASVEPPDVWYKLAMPAEVYEKGKLSALQLESVVYASQQHEQFLEDGNRAGFLIGDGAGVGKGRTIAGIILENFCKKRRRAVWVSVSNDLKYDAERDLRDIGASNIPVHFLSKMKYAKINSSINNNVSKGIIYSTYSALIGESQGVGTKYKTRLKQLLHWCGEDFDGVIIFDECHRAKNLCPTGAGKPTKTGQTVLQLQQSLPKARIVYASATGASEPKHMAYMVRLGIWGPGSPFRDFNEFLGSVEKRGVGAMEIVAMDMKLRGMYIARQLSFQGVGFKIDEVELTNDIKRAYNKSVEFWVELMYKFIDAAELIDADKKLKKTMWGQFWSAHQRFFKYLCIASKVKHVVATASEVMKMGKCVVIGLQSTGEARTLEAVEREEELTDFVSTAKGVLQSLVEKHFPAPDREKICRLLGLPNPNEMLEELDIKPNSAAANGEGTSDGKRKRKAVVQRKKFKFDDSSSDEEKNDSSDFEVSENEQEEEDDDDEFEAVDEDEDDDDDDDVTNLFGSDDDDDDPWAKGGRKRKTAAAKKKDKNGKAKNNNAAASLALAATDPFAHLFKPKKEANGAAPKLSLPPVPPPPSADEKPKPPPKSNVDRACQMKKDLLKQIEELGKLLPANTLDHLIDELGGTENVAEMTGRKGRVVSDDKGDVRYESRSEQDVPLETLNLAEKDRFMRGEKDVAIISEAASSGISLQADRRVKNQKRRVHMTLELPWSADRAIQQFGRTHRSNQVSAPEYILLISDLAGEQRFASIVAKRLESLGALTHGDRRATESRDLSRFNIDNKYGRAALEATFRAIMGYETPQVAPPADYQGQFFKDIADGLVGVGLIVQSEDCPGVLTLEKGYNDMSKFLNRILGLKVELQNVLFKYFSDTLAYIVSQAKREGRYDQGILDVGLTEEDHVELVKTLAFHRKHATGTAKIELHVLHVERGLSWEAAVQKWEEMEGKDDGFYLSHQVRNGKKTAILASAISSRGKKKEKVFIVYRPNTGQQVKQETLSELKKKYKKVSNDEAQPHWKQQFDSSASTCSHAFWRGNCRQTALGSKCEVGLRKKTYNVLTGSVLSVWNKIEEVLTHDGNRKGTNSKMQVVRLKLDGGKRIVGTLIPSSAMTALTTALEAGAEDTEETLF